jgi:hypothetical protein
MTHNAQLPTVIYKDTAGQEIYVKFEVLTAVTMKITVFWDATRCSLVFLYQRFRETEKVAAGFSKTVVLFTTTLHDVTS